MVQSLEEFVAQATNAYKPAQDAVQSQIDALSGQLATTNEQINKNYAQQQAGLNRQRNMAAETASMQAAGSGGSFGGAANIANRKYYDQSFVPAVTQMNTNKSNELAQARQDNENRRANLNSQLAQIQAQAQQEALQQYWAQQEAERNRAAQLASQNAYLDYMRQAQQAQNSGDGVKAWDFGNGYVVYDDGGEAYYTKNGVRATRGEFLEGTRGNTRWDLWNDIWNSGTKTNGIGSDTIQSFKVMPVSLRNTKNFDYLYY